MFSLQRIREDCLMQIIKVFHDESKIFIALCKITFKTVIYTSFFCSFELQRFVDAIFQFEFLFCLLITSQFA